MNIEAKTCKIIEIISNQDFCHFNPQTNFKMFSSCVGRSMTHLIVLTQKKEPSKKVMTKIHKQRSIKTRLLAGITKKPTPNEMFQQRQKKGAIEIYVFSISIHNFTNGFQI